MKQCELCKRQVRRTTRHHLIPKTRHGNKKIKRRYEREDLVETVDLCRACHRQVHALLSEKELAQEYNTLEKLLNHDGVRKFVNWVKDRPDDKRVTVRRARR